MDNYTKEELSEALRAINSIIHKCEKAQEKFPNGNSHHTLLKNRLKAMYISKSLISLELSTKGTTLTKQEVNVSDNAELLIQNLDKLHTTDMGSERIKKNLGLDVDDVINWCRQKIKDSLSKTIRRGKNWYITTTDCEITVNAFSYTIITAHKLK